MLTFEQDESAVINRIENSTVNKEAWIKGYVQSDPNFKEQHKAFLEAQQAAAQDPDDDEKQEQAEEEYQKEVKLRRTLREQGRIAFQQMQLDITARNLTTEDLDRRRKDAKSAGEFQKMLLQAAKDARQTAEANVERDPEEEDADQEDTQQIEDLQDARNHLESDPAIGSGEITVQNFTISNASEVLHPDEVSIAAACKTFMEILMGQTDVVKEKRACKLCVEDPHTPSEKSEKLLQPGALAQHLGTAYHSPKNTWLRRFKKKDKCPYPECFGTEGTGSDILAHVYRDVGQKDAHLLAAAKDGLFQRDFDPIMKFETTHKTRKKDGEIQLVEDEDPTDVPLSDMLQPRNVVRPDDADGEYQVDITAGKSKHDDPILRLPTKGPITETGWWHEHETGIHGDVADTMQAQARFILEQAENNLRALGKGQAGEKGETRTRKLAGKGDRRTEGIKKLRQRLVQLGWSWAEDADSVAQPTDDDEEPWEGFSDNNAEGADEGSGDDGN